MWVCGRLWIHYDVECLMEHDSCLPQVVDVAKAITSAVRDPDANGKTYALVG